jgi:hypothetical protein
MRKQYQHRYAPTARYTPKPNPILTPLVLLEADKKSPTFLDDVANAIDGWFNEEPFLKARFSIEKSDIYRDSAHMWFLTVKEHSRITFKSACVHVQEADLTVRAGDHYHLPYDDPKLFDNLRTILTRYYNETVTKV